MTPRYVHLGFEVGGDPGHIIPVVIPIRHMAVTGQTQESGKTTALEALITRSGLPAIAFLTKRGEASFTNAHQIKPFFQERADWQFVESILESSMKQRMKFERAWIIRACRGAKTLADVEANISRLQTQSKRSMDQDLYMLLGEYLAKVVPLIRSLPKSPNVVINDGLNVMDLRSYPEELQSLVISSTLDHIHKTADGVITVIPEAWKFIPQGRNTPVHMVAEKLIREGAGLRNYVWLDSQDMAGVDKVLLRGCPVWLIGIQREANELKRALANMPAMLKKPKAGDVAMLELGQFYACFGKSILKTYVQPAWMDEATGSAIASGRLSVHEVHPPHTTKAKQPAQAGTGRGEFSAGSPRTGADSSSRAVQPQTFAQEQEEDEMWKEKFEDSERQRLELQRQFDEFRRSVHVNRDTPADPPASPRAPKSYTPAESFDNEALYQAFKTRLMGEAPALIKLLVEKPQIDLEIVRKTVNMSTDSLDGNVAWLIHDGFFDTPRGNSETIAELNRRGWKTISPRMAESFTRLRKLGLIYGEDGKYRAVGDAKKRVVAA